MNSLLKPIKHLLMIAVFMVSIMLKIQLRKDKKASLS